MVSKILGYVRLFGRPYPPSIHGAPEAPNFEKSHQPAAGKVGFSYWKICWFALPLFGKGFFFHIDLERSRNFSCVSNHTSQKNQGLKWLFLGLICMWKKSHQTDQRPWNGRGRKCQTARVGSLPWSLRGMFFLIDLSLHLFDPMVFVG